MGPPHEANAKFAALIRFSDVTVRKSDVLQTKPRI